MYLEWGQYWTEETQTIEWFKSFHGKQLLTAPTIIEKIRTFPSQINIHVFVLHLSNFNIKIIIIIKISL